MPTIDQILSSKFDLPEEDIAENRRQAVSKMEPLGSYLVVELMRQGRSPQQACEEAIARIERAGISTGISVKLTALGLAAGVAARAALQATGIEGVTLKWPNDLVCDARNDGAVAELQLQEGAIAQGGVGGGMAREHVVELVPEVPEDELTRGEEPCVEVDGADDALYEVRDDAHGSDAPWPVRICNPVPACAS